MEHLKKALALAATIAAVGCGENIDQNYKGEPLGTLRGQVGVNNSFSITNNVALAIVWMAASDPYIQGAGATETRPAVADGCENGDDQGDYISHYISNTQAQAAVSFEPMFPLEFEVPIQTLPPAHLRRNLATYGAEHCIDASSGGPANLGGSGTISFGRLVAFTDGNANGQYDPGTPNAVTDLVLGVSTKEIMYLDGEIPDFTGGRCSDFDAEYLHGIRAQNPSQGFSIVDQYHGDPEPFTGRPLITTLSALDHPISLELGNPDNGNLLEFYACAELDFVSVSGGPDPLPGARVNCTMAYDDVVAGSIYGWDVQPAFDDALSDCVSTYIHGGQCLGENETPPADWPCVVGE